MGGMRAVLGSYGAAMGAPWGPLGQIPLASRGARPDHVQSSRCRDSREPLGGLWGASWRLLGFVIRFSIACDRHFQGCIFGRFRKTVLEPLTQLKCTMRALPPAIVARISAKVRERRDSLVEASTSG